MSLILIGLDEAGYGPLLGPLCVGMCAVRVHNWRPGEPAPNLWKVLKKGVTRNPARAKTRVPVEDSKKLKLPNDSPRHPLLHLEHGVLAWLGTQQHRPATDAELFALLGVEAEAHAWYEGDACALPVAHDPATMAVAANMLATACAAAGVELLALRCIAVGEVRYNGIVAAQRTKAATTAAALREHLHLAWERWGTHAADHGPDFHPRVVCDRQGGRTQYAEFLADLMPRCADGEAPIEVMMLEESAAISRYDITHSPRARRMAITFQPEAETAHLPVALASMVAKLCRELMMARFNRYWAARAAEAGMTHLKPTAGYRTDAWRWLKDADPIMNREERERMVRVL
ncbi:hypothetical protein BH11PLA1_BH11PLA1_16840 [soil metagenome]